MASLLAGLVVGLSSTSALLAPLLPAQTPTATQTPTLDPTALTQAAAAITTAEVGRQLGVFTSDSMRAGTAGGAHERAARYVAEQLRQLGLGLPPGPENGNWVQRYPLPGQRPFSYASSEATFLVSLRRGHGATVDESGENLNLRMFHADFRTAIRLVPEVGPPHWHETELTMCANELGACGLLGSEHTVVVAGPHTEATLRALDLHGTVVFYVPPAGLAAPARQQVLAQLYHASQGVVVVSDEDSVTFAQQLAATRQTPPPIVDHYLLGAPASRSDGSWVLAVRTAALGGFWGPAGLDLAGLRTATTPVAREVPSAEVWLQISVQTPDTTAADSRAKFTAPYVVGRLEGTDPELKWQHVVIAANMSTSDDQAPELAGLLALARAFSQPGARPRRSVLFVATSGAPPEVAGSWFVAGRYRQQLNLVAALTLERLRASTGAASAGTPVVVDGGPDVALAAPPAWVAAAHPKLGLAVVDSGTVFQPGTAAYAFARNGVPSWALHAAEAPDAPRPGALPAAESLMRVLQLAFYLGQELANGAMPNWTMAGRQRYIAALPSEP